MKVLSPEPPLENADEVIELSSVTHGALRTGVLSYNNGDVTLTDTTKQ
jgi:hypothetical protein